jgi:hypothetical protein
MGVRFRSGGGMKFDADVFNLLRSTPSYWYLATPYSDLVSVYRLAAVTPLSAIEGWP